MPEGAAAGGAGRVLFLPGDMYGHWRPMERLMRWFHAAGYSVHAAVGKRVRNEVPSYVNIELELTSDADLEGVCNDAGRKSTDFESSFVQMVVGFTRIVSQEFCEDVARVLKLVETLQPSAVVSDVGWNIQNTMYTMCQNRGIAYVQLVCPGRPELGTNMPKVLWLVWKDSGFGKLSAVMKTLSLLKEAATPITGKLLPDSAKPPMVLPGLRWMMDTPVAPHEMMVGPFLDLPPRVPGASGYQAAPADVGPTRLTPALCEWLCAEVGSPVVLASLGTVVQPTHEVLIKLAEAFSSSAYRVLWSLPQELQEALPSQYRQSSMAWRLESFLPQYEVLRCSNVKCFFSHCGANGTMEALSLGVPMVCMPFYCDQYEWAKTVAEGYGAGVFVHKFRDGAEAVRRAVEAVVGDPRYAAAAAAVADAMRKESEENVAKVVATPQPGAVANVSVAANVILQVMQKADPQRHFIRRKARGPPRCLPFC